MTRDEFQREYIKDVRIKIHNKEQCYKFQQIAFEFGAKVHSNMHLPSEQQTPIAYNIADIYPDHKGKSYAVDMDNLVIYDNGTRIQKSGFFGLEKDKKLITYEDFINAYESLEK
jgi:hypothetical protein